ncbi:hypothetical protein Psta_3900 [Pirellula staleyi DSM 6068]|uniref:Uncharacterized protein n=1 Tax=Pirellula staleyi (strain ATCC 27377 / DSM 6068 / ICPB 4128) TaxID=530564 RepID=D2R169_PIRSD|nr:hypothetical protein [Pirellula staleyi]ADB18554.1 hypothetical protein Psta_3900 [Pirellula staleyi DSM 6068]
MSENHFPELLEAAKRVVLDEDVYFASLPIDEMEAIVEANHEAIVELKRVLQQPCSMELPADHKAFCKSIDCITTLRAASKLLSLACQVAFDRRHFLEAMESAGNMLRLANIMRRGGLVVDMLAAIAIEGTAIHLLRKQRHHFDQPSREHLTKLLRSHVVAREDFDFIAARDAAWEAAQPPDEEIEPTEPEQEAIEQHQLSPEFVQAFNEYLQHFVAIPREQQLRKHESCDAQPLAMLRLLWLELLLFDYRETHGCYPRDLRASVPAEDSDMLVDPFSKKQFCYRTYEDGFVLYSVGPKQFDAGGKFGHIMEVSLYRADLCLDAADYPVPENVCFLDTSPNYPSPAPPPTLLQRLSSFFRRLFKAAPSSIASP